MIKADEDSLICDLAETYQIFNYRGLPARLVASFSVGLRNDSRIKMKLSGQKVSDEILLLAIIADQLSFLSWTKTKDAERNRNKPESIFKALTQDDDEMPINVFESGKDFEEQRQALLEKIERGHNGN